MFRHEHVAPAASGELGRLVQAARLADVLDLGVMSAWKRSSACCSSSRYIALRCASTSKSTWCASNSGPSTQANWLLPPTTTRQPPHMPVPSTMIELRLTTVLISCGPRDLGDGAHHRHGPDGEDAGRSSGRPRIELLELVGDEALLAVAAVVGRDEDLVADGADFVLEDHEVARARAEDRDDVVARLA